MGILGRGAGPPQPGVNAGPTIAYGEERP